MRKATFVALSALLFSTSAPSAAQAVISGPPAFMYGVSANGDLQWYRHNGAFSGTPAGVAGGFDGPKTVGYGWNGLNDVFSGGSDGVIYGIGRDGTLNWAKHTAYLSGGGFERSNSWATTNMKVVSYGWGNFQHVFAAGNGILYAIDQDGHLRWYKDLNFSGALGFETLGHWAAGSGKIVGYGWGNLRLVFSGGGGVIYMVSQDGTLSWARHTAYLSGRGFETPGSWATTNAKVIGTGWGDVTQAFSNGAGVIYAVKSNGDLIWNLFTGNFSGEGSWVENYGKVVGTGWNGFSHVFGF